MTVHKEGNNCCGKNRWEFSSAWNWKPKGKAEEECFASLSAEITTGQQPERKNKGIKSLLVGTNLDCENLITVQTCVCAVVRRTLRRGSDEWIKVRKVLSPANVAEMSSRSFLRNKNTSSANSRTYMKHTVQSNRTAFFQVSLLVSHSISYLKIIISVMHSLFSYSFL